MPTKIPERRFEGRSEAISLGLAVATMLISAVLAIAGMAAAASLLAAVFR